MICWKGGGVRFESVSGRPYSPELHPVKVNWALIFRDPSLSGQVWGSSFLNPTHAIFSCGPVSVSILTYRSCVCLSHSNSDFVFYTPFLPSRNRENGSGNLG